MDDGLKMGNSEVWEFRCHSARSDANATATRNMALYYDL